jgi:hypothetical protein
LDESSAIAMFTAYFDASGTSKATVITMAGFVSRVNKWERLEDEWPQPLPSGITSFHMTDFVSSRRGMGVVERGPLGGKGEADSILGSLHQAQYQQRLRREPSPGGLPAVQRQI